MAVEPTLAFVESQCGKLPETLEYTGEFGPELVLFMPFCNWLAKAGLLRGHSIKTYRGMRCFYEHLDCAGILEKEQPREWVPPARRPAWLPVKNEHDFDNLGRPLLHLYSDLRSQFGRHPLLPEIGTAEKPILVIHNKHNIEWHKAPFNHIGLATLAALFSALEPHFTIVYIRHGIAPLQSGFSEDHNTPVPFDDRAVLARHPAVLCFDDLFATHRALGGTQDINTFKSVLYSRCYYFISSQGGGAHQIALFSGALLVVLHCRGSEEAWAYGDGYYSFMATIPPIRAICRNDDDLLAALALFGMAARGEDRVLLNPAAAPLLARLSPWTIAGR